LSFGLEISFWVRQGRLLANSSEEACEVLQRPKTKIPKIFGEAAGYQLPAIGFQRVVDDGKKFL